MQSLFYGGAIAAVSGLLLGAGMKAPLAVDDLEPMTEVQAFQTAALDREAALPEYTPSYFVPVTDFRPVQSIAAEPAVEPTPAVYTVEADEPATEAAAVYGSAPAEPEPAMNLIRSSGAATEPAVAEVSQGFGLVGDEADPS